MTDRTPLAGLASDANTQTVALLLAEILANMPRRDANGRLTVNNSDQGSMGTLTTLTTVTTCATLTTQSNFGATSRPADAVTHNLASVGALVLYNQIAVN